jgi:WD40 repeat protein
VWDAQTGVESFAIADVDAAVAAAVFTPDGRHLVVGGRGGAVVLHRADDGTKVRDLARNRHGFDRLAISPDGARVALASATVTLVDVARGGVVGQLRPHVDRPYDVAFDPAGNRLASCSTDRSIAVADTRPLAERLAAARAARDRIAAAEARLAATSDLAAVRAAADRLWAEPGLDADERAAEIAALMRRAAALSR